MTTETDRAEALYRAIYEANGCTLNCGEAVMDVIVAALREQVVGDQLAEVERMRAVLAFVDDWVRHPVGHFSMIDLNVLFSDTRDKIAALSSPPPPSDTGERK